MREILLASSVIAIGIGAALVATAREDSETQHPIGIAFIVGGSIAGVIALILYALRPTRKDIERVKNDTIYALDDAFRQAGMNPPALPRRRTTEKARAAQRRARRYKR